MARKYYSRNRRGAKRRFMKAMTVAKVKKIIKGSAEFKFRDEVVNTNDPAIGLSSVIPISLIANGDSDVDRDGNEVYLESFQCKLKITDDATSTTDSLCRIMLVKVLDCNGAVPDMNEILTSDFITSLRNVAYNGDYRILWDKQIRIKRNALATQNSEFIISKYIKFKNKFLATFNAVGAGIAQAERNHLFLVLMSDEAEDDVPTWAGSVRVGWRDN